VPDWRARARAPGPVRPAGPPQIALRAADAVPELDHFADAAFLARIARAQGRDEAEALVLLRGSCELADLARALAAPAVLEQDGNVFTLRRPLVIRRGFALVLPEASALRLVTRGAQRAQPRTHRAVRRAPQRRRAAAALGRRPPAACRGDRGAARALGQHPHRRWSARPVVSGAFPLPPGGCVAQSSTPSIPVAEQPAPLVLWLIPDVGSVGDPPCQERAVRLAEDDPVDRPYWANNYYRSAYFNVGRDEDALRMVERQPVEKRTKAGWVQRAASHAALERVDAKAAVEDALARYPT
jgi:hypothetical protein